MAEKRSEATAAFGLPKNRTMNRVVDDGMTTLFVALSNPLSDDLTRSGQGLVNFPARSAHDPPGLFSGGLTVLQDLDAVYPHMAHAGRVLVWLLVRRVIGNRCRIEHDDVGEVAGNEPPTLLDP